jgi:lysine/ornithine N-monooxygenase
VPITYAFSTKGIGEHYFICGREVTKAEWEDHLQWVAKENKK